MKQPNTIGSFFDAKLPNGQTNRKLCSFCPYVIKDGFPSFPPADTPCRHSDIVREMCRKIVNVLPTLWHGSNDITCRILLDGIEYVSDNFKKKNCRLSTNIVINNVIRGQIDVYATRKSEPGDEKFSLENQKLTELFAQTLCHVISFEESSSDVENITRLPAESPNPILRASGNGKVLYLNNAAKKLLTSSGLADSVAKLNEWLEIIKASLKHGHLEELESAFDNRIFSFTFIPVCEKKYVNIYGRDITEQKQAESKFIQSQKLEAMGLLASGVAHDFRNQLTIIKGFGEMLRRRNLISQDNLDKVDMILKAVDNSTGLVNELLTLSHHEIPESKVVDLGEVTEILGKSVSNIIGEDIKLSINRLSEHCRTEIDPTLFNQAMINLVINARDAMRNGGTLTIETDMVEVQDLKDIGITPGKYAAVRISDSGMGMSQTIKARIFEPFFTTKKNSNGTGLGLTMVYGFVKKSGGHIECETSPGKGTVFSIFLPATDKAKDESQTSTLMPSANSGDKHVLVVEDDTSIRQMIEMSLHEGGYKVTAVGNPKQASLLANQSESPFDLLLTDVVMPDMSGTELAKQIEPYIKGGKILFLSGYTTEELERRGALSARRNMLQKPFTHMQLLQKIRQTLEPAPDSFHDYNYATV